MDEARIYLDACCLSRLTDDQSQARIRAEAEAIEKIFSLVRGGSVNLVTSEALEDEIRRIPSMERRLEVETLLSLASDSVDVSDAIAERAAHLRAAGYGIYDTLHLAAAEAGGADLLLTTDDRFISKAARDVGKPRISVESPLSWSQKVKT